MTKVVASKSVDKLKWFIALSVFAAAVVGNSYFVEVAFLYRVLGVVFLFIVGLGILSITRYFYLLLVLEFYLLPVLDLMQSS